ncbi:LpqN/LpqT family lipoprotein [Mycolicibacterium frederiksbergense]
MHPPVTAPAPANPRPAPPSEPPVFTSSWASNEDASRKPPPGPVPGPLGMPGPGGPPRPPQTNFGPPPLPHRPPTKPNNRRNLILAAAGIGAAVLLVGGITLAVTGGDSADTGGESTTSAVATDTTGKQTTSAAPKPAGHAFTIADYIRQNSVVETPVHRGDPGAPAFTLPTPPGWGDAGNRTPTWAYSAIVNDLLGPTDPPSVVSLISKLAGDVDANKLLEFAPNELQNLTDYQSTSDVARGELSGFPSVHLGGNYTKGGQRRAISQTTVVIPAPGNVYVLQINADAPEADQAALTDVNKVIAAQATITLP